MKNIFISLLLLVSQLLPAQTRVDTLRAKLYDLSSNHVFVTAHRGDWRYAPENSLPGIENVIKMGVDIVEIDIQRTKDGQFILMHDEMLGRTTTGKGKIADWTLDSIRTLHLKNGCATRTRERVPTLEEALTLTKGRVLVTLDKADRYFDEVYVLLERMGMTRQVIMCGGAKAEEVKARFGKYLDRSIYMPFVHLDNENAEEEVRRFIDEIKVSVFTLLFPDDANPLPGRMKKRLSGRALIWYNALSETSAGGHDDDLSLENPDAGYGYLIDTLGARIIQTDRPALLLDYLRKKGLHD